ncbi:hypothetical protein SAMN05421827_105126 [Pedobacter terrae]|uniref:Uncharacterized protein n=1 Tax=Pedobacter terrae TaxID=405671 RepID=A0A1G7TBP3_9SPHI|nr:hypothetical protein [Pedobacter terrae]SDG32059.1 hypothetical protein SAMN05421827_105126 [Pedobacter terrae]
MKKDLTGWIEIKIESDLPSLNIDVYLCYNERDNFQFRMPKSAGLIAKMFKAKEVTHYKMNDGKDNDTPTS